MTLTQCWYELRLCIITRWHFHDNIMCFAFSLFAFKLPIQHCLHFVLYFCRVRKTQFMTLLKQFSHKTCFLLQFNFENIYICTKYRLKPTRFPCFMKTSRVKLHWILHLVFDPGAWNERNETCSVAREKTRNKAETTDWELGLTFTQDIQFNILGKSEHIVLDWKHSTW